MKTFNTTGVCVPSKHYMVDLSQRVEEIKRLVDDGRYFTINRARQYGKTTTLTALSQVLKKEYIVLSLDFQGLDHDVFRDGATFTQAMARIIIDAHEFIHLLDKWFKCLDARAIEQSRIADYAKREYSFDGFRQSVKNLLGAAAHGI